VAEYIPKLVVWPQRILYTGHYRGTITFNHIKDTLVVSLGKPMSVIDASGEEVLHSSCVLVPRFFTGHLVLDDCQVVIVSLDVMGYSRDLLLENYDCKRHDIGVYYNFSPLDDLLPGFSKLAQLPVDAQALNTRINGLINPHKIEPLRREIDPRTLQVLKWARDRREEKLVIGEIAEIVGLSDSRVRHLFKKDMGFSLGQMLNSLKLLTFLEGFCRYGNMTYAAADAGFSDLSHLNKAMHKTLGLSFSKIMGGNKQVLMGSSGTDVLNHPHPHPHPRR
jgi:AraC-like DNA-binding protein